MKLSLARPSASMAVAITAFAVAVSGTAIAAPYAFTGDKVIKVNSLSGNRLRDHSVTGQQVDLTQLGTLPNATNASSLGGKPASAYQLRTSQGSALAGARINSDGTVKDWFNAFGGAPTVQHSSSGVYYLRFPSSNIRDGNSVLLVTPDTPSGQCTAPIADYASSGAGPVIAVITQDCKTGSAADRGFHVVAFGDSTTH